MKAITRKTAAWGSSILLVISIMMLFFGIRARITLWIVAASIATIIYSIGVIIVIYDLKKYG